MTDLTMGQRIAAERKRLGISQESLGEKLGVSRQAISKWEADGAVPEIDKLISLSKLFGVSVGWLLGVEEQPEKQADELTESQLKMVEEIVKQYQPQKTRNIPFYNFLVVLIGVIGIVALCISSWIFDSPSGKDYSSQIVNLEANFGSIQSQLSILSNRIDGISSSMEEAASPLSGYRFRLEPNNEAAAVKVTIEAVPKIWNEEAAATLYVRLNGTQYASVPFQWEDSAYVATVDVDYDNGYEYWMVLESPGGIRESVQLIDTTAQYPQRQYAITCEVATGNWQLDQGGWLLKLANFDAHLRQPYTAAHNDIPWEYAEWALCHIRGTQQEVIFTESRLVGGDANFTESWSHLNTDITLPELQAGDRLELWYRAGLSNGLNANTPVCSWTYTNGDLIMQEGA